MEMGFPGFPGFPKMGGTPKSSSLIGFSVLNHPLRGSSIYGNPQMGDLTREFPDLTIENREPHWPTCDLTVGRGYPKIVNLCSS